MILTWFKHRRRARLLAEPIPEAWVWWLRENIWQYSHMSASRQEKLQDLVRVFVAEKYWEGCGGLVMNDEIRVTIAGLASMLVLGIEPNFYFDRVQSILVYPDAYLQPQQSQHGIVVIEDEMPMFGEHWHRGPTVLSWRHVLENGRDPHDGQNLVLHEFAHHLDGLNGDIDGVPPLADRGVRRDWKQVMDTEHRRLSRMARHGRATLLDWYGATNKAEFFAVSTECFFERPHAMLEVHPDLYALLSQFYQQDPARCR